MRPLTEAGRIGISMRLDRIIMSPAASKTQRRQAVDVGELDDLTELGWLHGPGVGTVHLERAMSSPAMVIAEVACEHPLDRDRRLSTAPS